jgi:dipeptidyl-peptidase-4
MNAQTVPEITPLEFIRALEAGEVFQIDTRDPFPVKGAEIGMIRSARFLIPLTLLLAIPETRPAFAQETNQVTIDWMFDGGAERVAATPRTLWVSDGRLLVYDTLNELRAGGPFLLIDPSTGTRSEALNAGAALGSLREIAGAELTPPVLPWPEGFDGAGRKAAYLFAGDVFLLDLSSSHFERVTQTGEEELSATISPDGSRLAYVRGNDIYVYDIRGKSEHRLTRDGSPSILNGRFSWVYWEELFGHHDNAYWWSPDSKSIAFLRTDESGVSTTSFTDFEPYQARVLTQRYPQAGQKTPDVRVGFVQAGGGDPVWMNVPQSSYEYITGVDWLPSGGRAAVQTMNRAQTRVDLFVIQSSDGKAERVLMENDDAWVHMYRPVFLRGGGQFLWISEKTGYAHAYRYSIDGTLMNQVTHGGWSLRPYGAFAIYDESPLCAVDEKGGWAYFTAGEKSTIERHIYRVRLDGGTPERLSSGDGYHRPSFRPDGRFYVDTYSNVRTPPSLSLRNAEGREVQVLSSPRLYLVPHPQDSLFDSRSSRFVPRFGVQFPSFFRIPARDGFMLPAQISTPAGFDSAKKYPVIVYVYGGPGSPTVSNEWNSNGWAESIYFDQVLLRAGYIVFSVDNRSSASVGKVFEKAIRGQMYGDVELNDLMTAVHWLKSQPYVDTARVGIWGWSGGATYTLLAMTRSNEFKSGIAVAPVTDWRYYDAKWAELPMKRPEDNPGGYAKTSLVSRARDIHGRLLMVHGTDDDNVHPQNSQAFMNELIKAGILFDVMIYPMRKHTIEDPPARKHLFRTMLEFWKRNL